MDKSSIQQQNHLDKTSPALVDSFGRVHNYLRISLTERCNLRCTYCMPEEGIPLRNKAHFMSNEEIFEIAKTYTELGVNKIRLTGGEPLVRKNVENIIEQLGTLNTELTITTNAILVDRYLDVFKKAGIRSVNVSLDSLYDAKNQKITRRDHFKKVLKNIYLLLDEGFIVKVNMVVMNGVNIDEIVNFVELTKDKPLHIRFIEFMPFNGNKWDWSKGIGFKAMMDIFYKHYGTDNVIKIAEKPNETAKCFSINNYTGTFGIIASITNPFCSTCNRIRLTADGKIKNCLFSSDETDLLTALRNGQDIVPLILQSIHAKKSMRAGMNTMEDLHSNENIDKNRSMISIGG